MPAAPLWSWVAVALAVIFAGVAAYSYRGVRRREETIRRQLASESALKARFDDVFDRASDVMIVHDRRGRVSTINRAGEHVWIDVEADGFLYNMVRSIAGTLIYVGRGFWPESKVAEILEAGDREQAGPTAAAQGLFLVRVSYE